jgi:membrane protein required for colicin V production
VNQVDVLVLILLVPFALRGYWRGFCRETFALAGLVGGALAAVAFGPGVAHGLRVEKLIPDASAPFVAAAVIFIAVWVGAAVAGAVVARVARALLLGGVDRAGGALFGSAKGAALLGFMLLLLVRVAPAPLGEIVDSSSLGRPLMALAQGVLQAGRALHAPEARERA